MPSTDAPAGDAPAIARPIATDADERPARLPMALVMWAFVVLVFLIVVVLLILKLTEGTSAKPKTHSDGAPPQILRAISQIAPSVFDDAGAPVPSGPAPVVLSGQPVPTVGGLPAVIFVGAEFSPYSAAERWALVVALSRLGTFSHLATTSSSYAEVFAQIPTFSFDGASYKSSYLALSAVEQFGDSPSVDAPGGFKQINSLNSLQANAIRRFGNNSGQSTPDALPFVDIGGRLIITGAQIGFSPGVFSGTDLASAATAVSDPTTTIGKDVLGAANEITAAFCSVDGGAPASVCQTPGVLAGGARLGLNP